jgi:Uma2 family endonuclease
MADKIHLTTAEAFLQLPETLTPTQLLDGEIIMSPSPELRHQDIVLNLAYLLRDLDLKGRIHVSPTDVHLDDLNVVQPDILWIAPEGKCHRVANKYLSGAPDLVVEIFSPSSIRLDRRKKYDLYEKHGVREYWMVDPQWSNIEVVRLEETHFVSVGIFNADETFESPLLGKTIDVGKIFIFVE